MISNWIGYSLEQQWLNQKQNQASTFSTQSTLVARDLREGIFTRAIAQEEHSQLGDTDNRVDSVYAATARSKGAPEKRVTSAAIGYGG
jgi:hypothetical protein